MVATELPSSITAMELAWKAEVPMDVTEFGIVKEVIALAWNADAPIVITEFPNDNSVIELLPNAAFPMIVTEFGMATVCMLWPKNAYAPMADTELPPIVWGITRLAGHPLLQPVTVLPDMVKIPVLVAVARSAGTNPAISAAVMAYAMALRVNLIVGPISAQTRMEFQL